MGTAGLKISTNQGEVAVLSLQLGR